MIHLVVDANVATEIQKLTNGQLRHVVDSLLSMCNVDPIPYLLFERPPGYLPDITSLLFGALHNLLWAFSEDKSRVGLVISKVVAHSVCAPEADKVILTQLPAGLQQSDYFLLARQLERTEYAM